MSKRKSKNRLPTKTPTVPAGQKEQTKVAHLTQQQFSGPVPPPQILQGYDQIIPGAAERILRMAEEDAEHQKEIEKTAITLAGEEVKRGQRYGLTIGILAFITSIIALALGSEKTAIALGGTTVVGLVAVFVTGRIKQSSTKDNGEQGN
jgi:uncharacterized membrane protein